LFFFYIASSEQIVSALFSSYIYRCVSLVVRASTCQSEDMELIPSPRQTKTFIKLTLKDFQSFNCFSDWRSAKKLKPVSLLVHC